MSSKVQDHLGHMLNVQAEEGDITAMRCEDCGVDLDFTAGRARLAEREQDPMALDPLSPIVYRVPLGAFQPIYPGANDEATEDEADVVTRDQYQAHVRALVAEKGDLRARAERAEKALRNIADAPVGQVVNVWRQVARDALPDGK